MQTYKVRFESLLMKESTMKLNYKSLILFILCILLNVNSTVLLAQNTASNTLPEQQFYLAVKQNNVAEVRNGLGNGFEPHTLDSVPPNNSALHWAAWEGATDVMAELLKQKAVQVDVLNGVSETPLMIASLKGNLILMRQLIAAGAYPNKEGWTPLHYAASIGNVEAMKLLLEEHAYIDTESPNKTTPLMMAARSKQILAVKLLLDEGADFEAKNDAGWTVITFAEKADATNIVEGLKLREAALKARQAKPAWLR
jgi:uncharacterized protein